MSSSSISRKRPAPGASPLPAGPISQPPQQYAPLDTMLWDSVGANEDSCADVADVANPNQASPQSAPHGQALPSPSPSPSTVLALRDSNSSRALVPTAPRRAYEGQADQWGSSTYDGVLVPTSDGPIGDNNEDLKTLLARARKIEEEANRENPAPNQKRSIPPFVLKLSSFLNHDKNSDLIRWSDKGDSFTVLDEDDFAKKLIPEMFKHNNYASFVRQLNMYGFHKRVGLSDNSMRASEKKNKSPSEYEHRYFLRDHPVLQWLITKPNKNGGRKKQKQAVKDPSGAVEPDSDAEDMVDNLTGHYAVSDVRASTAALGRGQAGPLAKTEIGRLREQLAQVQQKQQQVLNMIQQLRRSQDEIVQRAQAFEQMHHRHENSITAILNFLANVFRKSLEESGGAQNISEMLASILPHGQNQAMPTGSVQDLGELFQQANAGQRSMSPGSTKRPQHLLPGIPGQQNAMIPSGSAVGVPSNPMPYPAGSAQQLPATSRVTEVFDTLPADTTSPNYMRDELKSNPQEAMMKLVGDTNARMTPGVDLPELVANTSATMPTDQRNRMVDSMSRRTAPPFHNESASNFQPRPLSSTTPAPSSDLPTPTSPHHVTSHSPTLNVAVPPSVQEALLPQAGINEVENLQRDIGQGINNVAQLLAPLSPNGNVTGVDSLSNGKSEYFHDSGLNFDVNQWLDASALDGNYSFDMNDLANAGNFGEADGNDFDFSLSGADFPQDADETKAAPIDGLPAVTEAAVTDVLSAVIEAAVTDGLSDILKTEGTSSPSVTEELQQSDLRGTVQSSAKRRKRA